MHVCKTQSKSSTLLSIRIELVIAAVSGVRRAVLRVSASPRLRVKKNTNTKILETRVPTRRRGGAEHRFRIGNMNPCHAENAAARRLPCTISTAFNGIILLIFDRHDANHVPTIETGNPPLVVLINTLVGNFICITNACSAANIVTCQCGPPARITSPIR